MTQMNVEKYRERLVILRDRLAEKKDQMVNRVQAPVGNGTGNDIISASFREDAVSTGEGDEEVVLGLLESVSNEHAEVVAALDRIANGKFGLCEQCGKKISQSRLQAIPQARRCATCSRVKSPVPANA